MPREQFLCDRVAVIMGENVRFAPDVVMNGQELQARELSLEPTL